MSGQTFPAGATPWGELQTIGDTYPGRDSHGYVTGYYVYARGVNSRRVSGPHATLEDAHAARDAAVTLDPLDIVCGHVFTSRGTIVHAPTGATLTGALDRYRDAIASRAYWQDHGSHGDGRLAHARRVEDAARAAVERAAGVTS